MTIGVLNPVQEIKQVDDNHPCSNVRSAVRFSRVKKCLFGAPDPEETIKYVSEELKQMKEEQKMKWEFDFDSETPLANNERFLWEKVGEPSQVEESPVPNSVPCSSSQCNFLEESDGRNTQEHVKYRQTTINEYWRCTKRPSNSSSKICTKRKPTENDVLEKQVIDEHTDTTESSISNKKSCPVSNSD